jgi:hypothetical protein
MMLTWDFCKIACWELEHACWAIVGICNMHVETQHLFLMILLVFLARTTQKNLFSCAH